MAKRKKLTIAGEIEKAAVTMQKLVRMKAADDNGYVSCVTCGRVAHYKTMDGGHYFSRRHTRLKLFTGNCHPQCKRCNMMMGDPIINDAYRMYIINTYGQRRLDAMKKLTHLPPKKFYRHEIQEHHEELKAQVREHKKRLGES
jgi:hypothetical protein